MLEQIAMQILLEQIAMETACWQRQNTMELAAETGLAVWVS